MIHPNMATMLCFVTTDADIAPELCKKACRDVADETFNMISVDGDTSTNDMLAILASGAAGNEPITSLGKEYYHFQQGLMIVCRRLARELAADGEGRDQAARMRRDWRARLSDGQKVAKSVICSSLFKAAMFGGDANWGARAVRHRLYGRGV